MFAAAEVSEPVLCAAGATRKALVGCSTAMQTSLQRTISSAATRCSLQDVRCPMPHLSGAAFQPACGAKQWPGASSLRRQQLCAVQRGRRGAVGVQCRMPVPDRTSKPRTPSIEAPSGIGSDDGSKENAPVLGGNRYSMLISVFNYIAITSGMGWAAWTFHPVLIDTAASWFHVNYKDSMVTPFQSSFFGVLSLCFSVFCGQSMSLLYERQRDLVAQFYEEITILEEVMEEAVYSLGDEAYTILRQVQKYINQEIRAPNNQLPPLEDGLALHSIRAEARRYRQAGADVSGVLEATLRLSRTQNMRQASALRALPFVHWALLYILSVTFCLTLVLLEPGGSFSTEGRRVLFTVLCSMMTFVLMVITDLSDPSEGVYSSATAMEERLFFTDRVLERHLQLPVIPEAGTGMANANTNAYLNRRPAKPAVTQNDVEGSKDGASGLASLSVREPPKLTPGTPEKPKELRGPQMQDLYGTNSSGTRPRPPSSSESAKQQRRKSGEKRESG